MLRRRILCASAFALAFGLSGASAQVPGWIDFSLSAIGNARGGTVGVAGEGRLPLRPRDCTRNGTGGFALRANGVRGSVRTVSLSVEGSAAGSRYNVGEGAAITLVFASGNTVEVEAGRGWVEVEAVDDSGATGSWEATMVQGRTPLTARGRFEAHFAGR